MDLRIIVILLSCCVKLNSCISCKDEKGKNVDWFIVYKLPKIPGPYQSGLNYAYLTSNDKSGWKISKLSISNHRSTFGRTLAQLFKNLPRLSYIFYNDHPSHRPLSAKAHAKGVVVMDKNDGFWLIHSIPKFPYEKDLSSFYPMTGTKNGQIALCLNFKNQESGEKIVEHLHTIRANNYESNNGANLDFMDRIDSLARVANMTLIDSILTAGGKNITMFAKNPKQNRDIYGEVMVNALGDGLKVETWRLGEGTKLDNECKKDKSTSNVISLSIGSQSTPAKFKYTVDHSKWAITRSDGFFCVADVNRMRSQMDRGGGAVCMEDTSVWSTFDGSIEEIEPCPGLNYKNKN